MATAKISLSVSVASSTNTTYKVTAKLYYYGNGLSFNNGSCAWKISATGQSSKTGTDSFTKSTSAQKLGEASFSWSKGSSSASKTISASFATGVSIGTLTTSKSITVPAKPYYKVTYKNVNNAGSTITKSVQYGNSHTLITPSAVTNYKFGGWKNSSGTTYSAGTSVKITQDVTYTAVWTLNVATFKFGSYTVKQPVNSTISSELKTSLKKYIEAFNVDDTNLSGVVISGTDTLIAKAKKGSTTLFTLDTLVDSTLFKKDSSGNFKYIGSASTKTLAYSFTYLKHNLYKYHINNNNTLSRKTYTDIAGIQVMFADTINNIPGYKPSGYYKKTPTAPVNISNFIRSDVYTDNKTSYSSYGYVNKANIQKDDTYYSAVYISTNNYYTELECYDAVRTTPEKLSGFKSNDNPIDNYISEDNSLNDTVKDESGTLICGYIKYKSPYAKGETFTNLNGSTITANKGLIGNYTVKINEEVLQPSITFVDDNIYIKFWSTQEHPTNEFYYVTSAAINSTNDLNYPFDSTPVSILIPSNTVVMDINKNKNVIAFGSEAPDDITEEMVLFNRPISFFKNDVMYQQFIITHSIDVVNISSGNYVVTTDSCNLYVKDINNTQYNLSLQKYDIVNILKTPNSDNISLNITLNRNGKSIIYRTILI